jgi:methionyl-tRNA formyltransferase
MVEKEKVVFIGGKDVGHGVLRTLMEYDNVISVYSNPSDLEKSWYKQIGEITKSRNIPYSVNNINEDIDNLANKQPDWLICAYYDGIVSSSVLNIPKKGSINIHLGLVQEYRGCYPTTYPIIDGKKYAGVTIHKMTSKIDGGDVYIQEIVNIADNDTGKSLYDKCTQAAVQLFEKAWPAIKLGKLNIHQEDISNAVYHKRSEFPSHEIDLSWGHEKIDLMVRALTFPPFQRPYFMVDGKKFYIMFGE